LPTIFNPEDLHALETALKVRDEYGGTVTVVTMGPPKAADVLRDSLFRGADRAILLTDRRAAASDTLAPATFSPRPSKRSAVRFCVLRPASDRWRHGPGWPAVRREAGIPQITYLEELVSVHDRVVRVRRSIGHGWEIVEARLPVLVTVVETANRPRPLAAKRVMRMKRRESPPKWRPK